MKRKTQPKPAEIVTDPTQYAPKCPTCKMDIAAQATVERFGEPAKWNFWGYAGERWRRCTGESGGYSYVHFRTVINDQFSERLAWIKPEKTEQAVQQELTL